MLRVHCVQWFYKLSDPGMEDLLYEVAAVRRFVGLRLSGALPGETTILHFRHLLERHGLGEALFKEINAHLDAFGHRLQTGAIVDASLIAAPSSTKNCKGERDPEMHRTKKGNQWSFGMKAHIGVDARSGLTHSLETTPANTSDVATAHALLHGGEERVWGDTGYQGVGKREENRDTDVDWQVAMKAGKRWVLDKAGAAAVAEKRKASVRAKVEHPFLYVNGGGIMLHRKHRVCPVTAAQNCAIYSPLSSSARGGDVWRGALCGGSACGCRGGSEPQGSGPAVRYRPSDGEEDAELFGAPGTSGRRPAPGQTPTLGGAGPIGREKAAGESIGSARKTVCHIGLPGGARARIGAIRSKTRWPEIGGERSRRVRVLERL